MTLEQKLVVLIEDDESINDLIKDFLLVLGNEVLAFKEANQIVECLPDKVDCFVIDLFLPNTEIKELLDRIEQNKRWTKGKIKPKCIFISARRREEIKDDELYSPWAEYTFLEKPFSLTQLSKKLDGLFSCS
jgi:CheY-like chemotaxis protein